MKIVVFSSHNGSDLQAIIDGCNDGRLNASVVAVISNNSGSYALTRSKEQGIDTYYISDKEYSDVNAEILKVLDSYNPDIVFLAGYLKKVDKSIIQKYHNRIFNIHPALLPKYGGKGMYGINVHKAVIDAKESETGITIHRVSEIFDDGEIIDQRKVPVDGITDPEELAAKVLEEEHIFIVDVLKNIVDGKVSLG